MAVDLRGVRRFERSSTPNFGSAPKEELAQFRPLDPNRVTPARPSTSMLRAAGYPSLAHVAKDQEQDRLQRKVIQAASPQKSLLGTQSRRPSPGRTRDSPSLNASASSPLHAAASSSERTARGSVLDARNAFGPRLRAEEPCPSKPTKEPETRAAVRLSMHPETTLLPEPRNIFGPRCHSEEPCPAKNASLGPQPPSIGISSAASTSRTPRKMAPSASPAKQNSQKTKHRRISNNALSVKLDQEVFRNFWPLLDNSRDYARLSGCRFRSRSFDGISGCGDQAWQDIVEAAEARAHFDETGNPVLVARAQAAPAVYSFAERLRGGEAALLEELDKAFRIVMAESVRSAMTATCQLLELWPPSPAPVDVADDDCAFEDVSAPVPVIAQRLYNDERRRKRLTSRDGDLDPMRRRAMMASFIVEFATAAGAALPELPNTYEMMLKEFKAQTLEWERAQEAQQKCDSRMPWELVQSSGRAERSVDGPCSQIEVGSVPNRALESQNLDAAEKASMWPTMPSMMFASSTLATVFGTSGCGSRPSQRPKKVEV